MSHTEQPPSSGRRPAGPASTAAPPSQDAQSSRASSFPSAGPRVVELEASFRYGDAHPWIDLAMMRSVFARAHLRLPDLPQERAQGYRLVAVHDRQVSWADIRLDGDGYVVLGSHSGCDLVLSDAAVWRRHLAVVAVRLEDNGLCARLVDLKTDVPFCMEDDTPRLSALARGRFVMRLGGYVVCGFPVIFLDALRGAVANDGAVQAVPVVEPVPTLDPLRHLAPTSPEPTRLILARGALGAAVEVPAEALDEGVILGRALNSFDSGLRRVLSDEAISCAQLLLLRTGAELFAYDLCSTNGTRVAGRRIRRHRVTSAEPTLELGRLVTLTIRG